MKIRTFGIVIFLIFFLSTGNCFAAGMIMRIQQMKAMKQHQAQGQYQQQNVQGVQVQNQAPPVQRSYQQSVDARNQAIAQAIIQANASATQDSLDVNSVSISQSSRPSPAYAGAGPMTQAGQELTPSPLVSSPSSSTQGVIQHASADVQDEQDLTEVWKKLDKKSTVWKLLIDDQAKTLTVSEYINRFGQEGVKISAPPSHYVQMIDQAVDQNPQMLDRPFGELLQILAIIDYDFDNGMDRDILARKVLGPAGYEANKQRFSQQH